MPLTAEENGNVEIVKAGKNQSDVFSAGAVVRVACNGDDRLNIGANRTVRCKRGNWRPDTPVCIPIGNSSFLSITK